MSFEGFALTRGFWSLQAAGAPPPDPSLQRCYHPRCGVVGLLSSSRSCLCHRALSLLKTKKVHFSYIFRIFRSISYIKVIGSRSRSNEQKACLCVVYSCSPSCLQASTKAIVFIPFISDTGLGKVHRQSCHLLPVCHWQVHHYRSSRTYDEDNV